MAYHKEIKVYRPIIQRAKNLRSEGITLSRQGHVLLSWSEDTSCKLQCSLGWENEKVTHIKVAPNDPMNSLLEDSNFKTIILEWVTDRLEILFKNSNVSVPEIRFVQTDTSAIF